MRRRFVCPHSDLTTTPKHNSSQPFNKHLYQGPRPSCFSAHATFWSQHSDTTSSNRLIQNPATMDSASSISANRLQSLHKHRYSSKCYFRPCAETHGLTQFHAALNEWQWHLLRFTHHVRFHSPQALLQVDITSVSAPAPPKSHHHCSAYSIIKHITLQRHLSRYLRRRARIVKNRRPLLGRLHYRYG